MVDESDEMSEADTCSNERFQNVLRRGIPWSAGRA
jgi:hypothetical protein